MSGTIKARKAAKNEQKKAQDVTLSVSSKRQKKELHQKKLVALSFFYPYKLAIADAKDTAVANAVSVAIGWLAIYLSEFVSLANAHYGNTTTLSDDEAVSYLVKLLNEALKNSINLSTFFILVSASFMMFPWIRKERARAKKGSTNNGALEIPFIFILSGIYIVASAFPRYFNQMVLKWLIFLLFVIYVILHIYVVRIIAGGYIKRGESIPGQDMDQVGYKGR